MSGISKKLMSASGGVAGGPVMIEDAFSSYLYTGNGGTQTITNGVDLAGEGGLVWIKDRVGAFSHNLADTERGANNYLFTDSTQAQFDAGTARISSFNSDGFSLGSGSNGTNASGNGHASWTFRKAPRFFDVVTYTGDGVAGRTVSHNLGTTVGTILVKNLTSAEYFAVYHISQGETKYALLGNTDAFSTFAGAWDNTAPTTTEFSVGNWAKVNTNGDQYVAYLYAHDPLGPSGDGSDGLIACGSYTGTGSLQHVDLGWEPQYILIKNASSDSKWVVHDVMRGLSKTRSTFLVPNATDVEFTPEDYSQHWIDVDATGFNLEYGAAFTNFSGDTYIYIAIRRGPMRAPESGTEVFAVEGLVARTESPWFRSGFPVDFVLRARPAAADEKNALSRLTGDKMLRTDSTNAETTNGNAQWDYMDGYADAVANSTFLSWMFRRAPGFFDVVAYTGDGVAGRTVPHNLGVAPEMIIFKARNTSDDNWFVYAAPLGPTKGLNLNATNAAITSPGVVNDTAPTESVFSTSAAAFTNIGATNYIAYLFSTLAGISKVGSYTGNGSSQTINCGFTTGARFIIIKRTDSTGDWYVWDTARGIVAANDPHLSLNTTAAEVTTDDSIDPDSSGFIVNQVAATNINVSAASYIFYAVS